MNTMINTKTLLTGVLGFLLASSCLASGLSSLILEGHELHASLRALPLKPPIRHLPPGLALPDNPHLSTDAEFVGAIARSSSQGKLGREGIHSALYARYVGEGGLELGIYGLGAESTLDADWREAALRIIWAYSGRLGRAHVHREGLVLVVVWHDGVSPECRAAVNASVAERLAIP